jgi:hypothetical protein
METTDMRYYRYEPDANKYAGIGASSTEHERVVDVHFRDTPFALSWCPVVVHGFDDNPEMEGEFPSLSDFCEIPVFSQKSLDVFRPLIGHCTEALRIVHPSGKPFYIIHVMETIDCLNVRRSDVKRFSDGRVMRVERYCLEVGKLEGKHIFKLPQESGRQLLVDDVFRETVEKHSLSGLLFREIPRADGNTGRT